MTNLPDILTLHFFAEKISVLRLVKTINLGTSEQTAVLREYVSGKLLLSQ